MRDYRVAPGGSGKHPDAFRDMGSTEEHIQTNMLWAAAYQQKRTADALERIAEALEVDDE